MKKVIIRDALIFVFCFIMYGLNEYIFKSLDVQLHWFFIGYYNDVLASIILLSYSSLLIVIFAKRQIEHFVLCSILIVLIGVFWEYVTPWYKKSTSDPLDLVAYYIGFLIYWLVVKYTRRKI